MTSTWARPLWGTPRTPDRPTYGPAVARLAEKLGRPMMPHQRYISDVAGEVLPDGRMAYPIVVLLMPRRGGKTATLLPTYLQRCAAIPRARCWYTAQTGGDAGDTLRQEWVELLNDSPLSAGVKTMLGNGRQSMTVQRTGGRVQVFAPTPTALHGKDADMAAVDEGWAFSDTDGTLLEQAIRPAMATRRQRQLWIVSAGGSEDVSTWLLRWRRLGRQLGNRPDQGVCFIEWHPPVVWDELRDDYRLDPAVDLDDWTQWHLWHPAVGHTVDLEFLRAERQSMGAPEFRRAYLNVFSSTLVPRLIPAEWWDGGLVEDLAVEPGPGLSAALDVSEDRASGAVSVARRNDAGGADVELAAYRRGTSWMPDAVRKLRADNPGVRLLVDARSPALTVGRALESAGLDVTWIDTQQLVAASGEWYDDCRDGRLRHREQPALTTAVEYAERRRLGDAWAFMRRNAAEDTSPLLSGCLAAHDARHRQHQAPGIFSHDDLELEPA